VPANVRSVAARALCCGCGTCVAACPRSAIAIEETAVGLLEPRVDLSRCTECGLCVRVCPGAALGSVEAEAAGAMQPDKPMACYRCKATDPDTREGGQSAGAVSALLLAALFEGLADCALITRFRPEKPTRPQTIAAGRKEEILSAQGSKYCPVAANAALAGLEPGPRKLAVVGLPCHIRGVRLLCLNRPAWADRIALRIGLFCDRTLSYAAIDHLARWGGVHPDAVASFQFRSRTWRGAPGDVKVVSYEGRVHNVPRGVRMRAKALFTQSRCRLCTDQLNCHADIAIGDPWGMPPEAGSVLLVWSQCGAALLASAVRCGALEISPVPWEQVVRGQSIIAKIRGMKRRIWARRRLGLAVPDGASALQHHSRGSAGVCFFVVLSVLLARILAWRPVVSALGRLPARWVDGIAGWLGRITESPEAIPGAALGVGGVPDAGAKEAPGRIGQRVPGRRNSASRDG